MADNAAPGPANGMRTAVAFHERDLARLWTRLDAIQERVEQIAEAVAAQPSLFADRQDLAALETRVNGLETIRDRAAGAQTWLSKSVLIGFSLLNTSLLLVSLFIAAKAAKLL